MTKRRTYTPEFKVQVVLEMLTGAKSAAQLSREHRIKDSVLSRWKQEFIERAPQMFERAEARNQDEARIGELERMVGRLTMELDIAKKASMLLNSQPKGNGS